MNIISIETLSRAISDARSIRLHHEPLANYLAQLDANDTNYEELHKLLQLSQQCENLEIQVKPEDAELINRFNALSDQLSYKLASMNAI
ncbi:hypothetical protein F0267_22205 [Vibrio coralliilyticus]|uniref:Uncharacterized protein n=1 Tax=Vibrio coralliilyticus TaxID=190893 RepID=A0AAN0W011_9VIBR|nr:hypothetical protein [Vibrio coralliilyticus]AIW22220.1 hypothetical protein IX92_20165 [Vibrio coralliilyticus]NOH40941.1 hypothetical protein [Vibrio coralliilyticus]